MHKPITSSTKKSKSDLKSHKSLVLIDLNLKDIRAHVYGIKIILSHPLEDQIIDFPQWIVGSYMIREFSKHLHNLHAYQARTDLPIKQLTKSRWQITCNSKHPLTIEYDIYARDPSVRGAWLDLDKAFFNGTSLFFECDGHAQSKHLLSIFPTCMYSLNEIKSSFNAPLKSIRVDRLQYAINQKSGTNTKSKTRSSLNFNSSDTSMWRVHTSLRPEEVDSHGFGIYSADSFERLVDSPVLISSPERTFSAHFVAKGLKHHFVVYGAAASFDSQRLLLDAQKICETVLEFWHKDSKPVIKEYLFILNVSSEGFGGLEHLNSTVLQCKRTDLPSIHQTHMSEGYIGLLGLISHEYFHTWNVKRLRPADFKNYKFDTENYTQLLWFFEGFTSYYDDLLLRRSGLITNQQYLKLVKKNIQQVLQTPGRRIHSVAQSSFEAWTKYYKADENTPNITVSYYAKGALIALCFDLLLRQNNTNLDLVMRSLFHKTQGSIMTEEDFLQTAQELSARSLQVELKAWVHGVQDLPFKELLESAGVKVTPAADPIQQQLGIRVDESRVGSVLIKQVHRGGVAELSGFEPGDEWFGVEVLRRKIQNKSSGKSSGQPKDYSNNETSAWKISKVDDLLTFLDEYPVFYALVFRDQRILRLRVEFSILAANSNLDNFSLTVEDEAKVMKWLM